MQPQSPKPNLDFIMKDPPKPKKNFGLPGLGLPRPVAIALIVIIVLIIIILIYAAISGSKGAGSTSLTSLAARAQEMSRTASLAVTDSQDPNLQALATTVKTTMDSQENQFSAYLSVNGQKLDPKVLAASQNSTTDQLFQSATQNGNLSSTYANYLVSNLNSYKIELADQATKTNSTTLKKILTGSIDSVQVLIDNASPLQSSQ